MKFSFSDITYTSEMIRKLSRYKYVNLSSKYDYGWGANDNLNKDWDLLRLLSRRIMLHRFNI